MIYGWDISTSIIGVATFTNEGKYTASYYIDLRDTEGLLAKADVFKQWLDGSCVNTEPENYHFVEDRLMGFAAGRSSQQTMMKLAQFNAICSWILYDHNPGYGLHRQVSYLHPSSWKSTLKLDGLLIPKGSDKKKEITLEFVRRKEPEFDVVVRANLNRNDNPQPWCFDMADAWCLARAGFRRMSAARKEAGGPAENPGRAD